MCVYRTKDGKCRKYSGNGVVSFCVDGPCPDDTPRKGGLTLTVNEWRAKHKKCAYCKHCSYKWTNYHSPFGWCSAKIKSVNDNLPRPFCKLFELKED